MRRSNRFPAHNPELQQRRALRSLPWWAAAVSALALTAASACGGGPIPKTNYYVLHLPEPPAQTGEPLQATAVLMQFAASPMLTQDRIVYRPAREEVGFYEYHRWAEDPRTTITNAFLTHLRRRRLFAQVAPFDGRTNGDYFLQGRIERLEEIDFEAGVSARVKLSLELSEMPSRKPLWQGSAEAREEVTAGEVREVVSSLSVATQRAIERLASDLASFVRSAEFPLASSSSPPPPEEQK